MRSNTTVGLTRYQYRRFANTTLLQTAIDIVSAIALIIIAIGTILTTALLLRLDLGIVTDINNITLSLADINEKLAAIEASNDLIAERAQLGNDLVVELDAAFDAYVAAATPLLTATAESTALTAAETAAFGTAFSLYSILFADWSRDILCQNDCIGCTRLCDVASRIEAAIAGLSEEISADLSGVATEATLATIYDSTELLILEVSLQSDILDFINTTSAMNADYNYESSDHLSTISSSTTENVGLVRGISTRVNQIYDNSLSTNGAVIAFYQNATTQMYDYYENQTTTNYFTVTYLFDLVDYFIPSRIPYLSSGRNRAVQFP